MADGEKVPEYMTFATRFVSIASKTGYWKEKI